MSPKALGILIKSIVGTFLVIVAACVWYYAFGRKPSLAGSIKIDPKSGHATAHLIEPGEVLLVIGRKASLFSMSSGEQKWSVTLPAANAPAAAPAAPTAKAEPATPAPEEKPDPLLVKRVERRFAKLNEWAEKLNAKRGKLKTPVQIEAFNDEAKRYHAELAEARAEAAPLHKHEASRTAAAQAEIARFESDFSDFDFGHHKMQAVPLGGTIWLVDDAHVIALDQANGRATRDLPLAGTAQEVLTGPNCLYIVAKTASGGRQVACISGTDGTAKAITTNEPPAGARMKWSEQGAPPVPNVQATRSDFTAAGGEMLQADVRLVESKLIEHQFASPKKANASMEDADKKTKGGWAEDAVVVAQAMAQDSVMAGTGGKEKIDTSTYEVTLRRPFASPQPPPLTLRVEGRPEILSSTSIDLVIAGKLAVAVDHANKKLWESAQPNELAFSEHFALDSYGQPTSNTMATSAQPCLEEGTRLYLFDRAFLTALDRTNGKPLWRLPSVGILKIQLDGQGHLYVHTLNASPETLRGAADIAAISQTLKLDAATGKILWKAEKYDDCFVSNGSVYVAREARNAEDMIDQVFDRDKKPITRFKLYKLSARDGQPQWEWFQTRRPMRIEPADRSVSLLFEDELQLIKSIAL